MRRGRHALALAALAAAVASPAALGQESGPFVGAGFGQSKFKEWCDNPGGVLRFDSCKDTDTAWKLFGGYRFNRYLAIEASYIDWGDVTANGTVAATGSRFDVAASQHSYGLAGVASVQLGPIFGVFGKIGYVQTQQETRRNLPLPTSTAKRDEDELHYGLGARFGPANWAVRAEWENTEKLKVEMFSIGVEYRF